MPAKTRDRNTRTNAHPDRIQWIQWTGAGLPAVLVKHPRWRGHAATVRLLAPCCVPTAETACDCGGLLAYSGGRWQHVNRCLSCHAAAAPCERQHVGCTDPAPRRCLHRHCNQPVTLTDRCALDRALHECDGCCWDLDDPPAVG